MGGLPLALADDVSKKPALDLYGDSLPDGSVARLGTARLRAMCGSIYFAPGGKTLVGLDAGRVVRTWDADNGAALATHLLPGRPERSRWGLIATPSRTGAPVLIADGSSVEVWDTLAGKRLDMSLPPDSKGLGPVALSDDGRLLLCAQTLWDKKIKTKLGGLVPEYYKQKLVLWDTASGASRLLAEDESQLVSLAIAPGGRYLASSSYGKGTRVWDALSGQALWAQPKYNAERVAFTPDGAHLIAAPGGGQNAWHIWETTTGRPAKKLQPPTVGYVWTFAVSPAQLLIPTVTDYVLWDLSAGKVKHAWPGAHQAGKGVFAPDGRSVVTYDSILQRWDVATGRPLYADVAALGHTAAVERLFFTPDGQRLASVAGDAALRTWDVSTSKPLQRLGLGESKPTAWALSPDGSTLAGIDEALTVQRWSIAETRPIRAFDLADAKDIKIRLLVRDLRFVNNGRTLAVSAWPRTPQYSYNRYSFSFWNAETGRLESWGSDPGRSYRGDGALSPDGRFAAAGGVLIDTRNPGTQLPLGGRGLAGAGRLLFSPTGLLLAETRKSGVRVWEAATGQAVSDLPEAAFRHAAFSPDGRLFASPTPQGIGVWDVRTGKKILERAAPSNRDRYDQWASTDFVFSPDGRLLATGQVDGTILLWNMPSFPGAPLASEEMAALWDDLGKDDTPQALAAMWRLQEDPDATAAFLETKVPLIPAPAADELNALIRELNSEQFKERDAATRKLKKLGRAAEAALRGALKSQPSLEQKQRLEALLSAPVTAAWPRGENLYAARVVAILEARPTRATRRVLHVWAQRAQDAWVAEQAARALAGSGD
jgi:WD40 repeat protein